MKKFITILLLILLFAFSIIVAAEKEKKEQTTKQIPILSWLKIGPIPSPLPVFHDTKSIKGKEFDLKELLKFDQVKIEQWWPTQEDILTWNRHKILKWMVINADSNGVIIKSIPNKKIPEITYLASYIDAKRWVKAKLEIFSCHLLQVYLDGKVITSKVSSDKPKSDTTQAKPKEISQDLKLETGKHLLLVKTLRDPENQAAWNIKAVLKIFNEWSEHDINLSTSSKHNMNIKHLLDSPKITDISISPDGELVAVSIKKTLPPSDESESWLELYRVKDGSLMQTFRGGTKVSNIQWAPTGKRFSYTSSKKEEYTLWIVDIEHGTTTPLLENIKDLSGHTWSPIGEFIIYSITEKPEPDKSGVKKLEGMPDRWPWWRKRNFLYMVSVPEGIRTRLTSGKLTTELNSISPDGKKLIFTRSIMDFSERPYSKTEFYILNLFTMELDSLWTSKWAGNAQWSPDGEKLLITGGPSMFGGLGINLPADKIPNDYDTQAYIYHLKTKKVDPITRNFNPTINEAFWSKTEDCIYFNTTDRSYHHLYRYDLNKKRFQLIDTGIEVLNGFDIAENTPLAVYTGSSATVSSKAFVINLKKKKYRILIDPCKEDFKDVEFNKVERWTFKNKRGVDIEGRIYYPPDFDPNKKYPCIVYYYGGTSPVTRNFGGRYPKNLYAAQGYVVYVLQPSGAIGFGQAFSALHVNDWGIIVADEIIDGVRKFIAAHPFINEKRVGCIGASYGGFMTMLLQTRTDIFAAAVAHAGISSISSYWGEGYWGYLYSAVATANSFPWNRKDIYIEQSPLFHADKVNTPILLLHGTSDTNVPVGESIQFYTALKLLDKEVELIQVEGQDHHILKYNKRILWLKSILAWFDRWLKDEPQWWYGLYPPKK